jgi:hypothetical protein
VLNHNYRATAHLQKRLANLQRYGIARPTGVVIGGGDTEGGGGDNNNNNNRPRWSNRKVPRKRCEPQRLQ